MLLIVGLHELGHLLAAKWLGVGVRRFSLGLGRPIYTKQLPSGIEFALGWCPIGGYVKLLDTREGEVNELAKAFDLKPTWQKISILLAGPLVNLVVAYLCFWGMLTYGIAAVVPAVGSVLPGSIAAHAGMEEGDKILAVNDWPTPSWPLTMMAMLSHGKQNQPMNLHIRSPKGESKQLSLKVENWHFDGIKRLPLKALGIELPNKLVREHVKLPWLNALREAFQRMSAYSYFNLVMLKKVITAKMPISMLGGPLSLLHSAQVQLQFGLTFYLRFLALLSLGVAIVNLLPIPGLDGGHILFALIEKCRGKPISIALQVLIFRLMLAVLLVVIMQLIANDLHRIGEFCATQGC